jgi:plasmid stabilization system protein ParE
VHVVISEPAIDDLGAIVAFVAQRDREAAARLGHELVDACLDIGELPARFHVSEVVDGVEFRRRNVRTWAILFRIDEDAVRIVTIRSGRLPMSRRSPRT